MLRLSWNVFFDFISSSSFFSYDLGLPSHSLSGKTPSSNVPHLFASTYDTNAPGYGYPSSNLKSQYLSREQLQARMIAPSIVVPSKLLQ